MITRRRFLKTMGMAGSAGLVIAAGASIPIERVLGQTAPSPSAVSRTTPPSGPGPVKKTIDSPGPGVPAPNFVKGTVVTQHADMLYISTPGGDKVVRLTNGTQIWKGGPADASAVAKGDIVQATGVLLPDGTIAATIVDVDVAQVRGTVAQVTVDGWLVSEQTGLSKRVLFDSSRPPEVLHNGVAGNARALQQTQRGTPVIVIGLQLPDGSLRATKVLLGSGPQQHP